LQTKVDGPKSNFNFSSSADELYGDGYFSTKLKKILLLKLIKKLMYRYVSFLLICIVGKYAMPKNGELPLYICTYFGKKIGVFLLKTKLNYEQKMTITLFFFKTPIFSPKSAKIAENCVHKIYPWYASITVFAVLCSFVANE
jgi:hypothetical protein